MGIMFDAFKDAAFEGVTGQRRRNISRSVDTGLNAALVDRIRALITSGLPECPHGYRYALESLEIKWGLPQGRDRVTFWACSPDGPLHPDLVLRLVCSHDECAGTFAVGSLVIMDASGRLTNETSVAVDSRTEDDEMLF